MNSWPRIPISFVLSIIAIFLTQSLARSQDAGSRFLSAPTSKEEPAKLRKTVKKYSDLLANKDGKKDYVVSDWYIARAGAYFDLKDYINAERDYKDALELDPENWDAKYKRARCWAMLGFLKPAIDQFQEYIKHEPQSMPAHLAIAACYLMQDDTAAAIEFATKALKLDKNDPSAYHMRGCAYFIDSKYKQCMVDIDKCLTLARSDDHIVEQCHVLRSFILSKVWNRPKEGLKEARKALEKNPNSINGLLQLWSASFGLGDFKTARATADDFIKAQPRSKLAHFAHVISLIQEGKKEEALKAAKATVELAPDSSLGHWCIAKAQFALGSYDEALKEYDNALEVSSEDFQLFAAKAYVLASCPEAKYRDGSKARELAEYSCKITDHKNSWILMVLALAQAECGQFDDATNTVEKALKLAPEGFPLRAEYERRLKLFGEKKAYRYSPDSPPEDYLWY